MRVPYSGVTGGIGPRENMYSSARNHKIIMKGEIMSKSESTPSRITRYKL